MALDSIDRELIRALQANGRATNRALASTVGLAPSSTSARVRELETAGVIRGYHADIDLAHLDRTVEAMVFVRLQPKSAAMVERFVEHAWAMPQTVGVLLLSGGDDVLVHVAVPDTEALRVAVLQEISSFDGVVDERTSLVFEYRRKFVVTDTAERS